MSTVTFYVYKGIYTDQTTSITYTGSPTVTYQVITVPGLNINAYTSGSNGYIQIYGTCTADAGSYAGGAFVKFRYGFTVDTVQVDIVVSNPPTYTHTIAYNANGGSGSMSSTTVTDYNSGSTNVTFASNGFTAPAGHYFAGWRINNTGTVYQPGGTYSVGGNGSVTAYAYWLPNSYTVSLSAGTGGSVSGGGTYTYGSSCTITATPDAHYHFKQWSDGNTSASRTFTVTGNVTLSASFEIDKHTVTLTAGTGGSVSGGGTYDYGSSVTISATPDAGYEFKQWSDGDTNATRTITVTGDVTLSASFKLGIAQIPVKVSGAWTNAEASVKVSGSWVPVKKVYMKVNGTWEEKI